MLCNNMPIMNVHCFGSARSFKLGVRVDFFSQSASQSATSPNSQQASLVFWPSLSSQRTSYIVCLDPEAIVNFKSPALRTYVCRN